MNHKQRPQVIRLGKHPDDKRRSVYPGKPQYLTEKHFNKGALSATRLTGNQNMALFGIETYRDVPGMSKLK